MKDKKIYILLTDTSTILTKIIKCYTKKPYNHASIAFDSNLTEVYSFGRKMPRNPFIGGFVKEDIHSVLFRQASCAIYSFTVTDEEWKKMNRYIQKIEAEKENYRYNFLGLFGFLFNRPIKRKRAFFCSQFVASVLQESDLIDNYTDLSLVKPSDIPHLTNMQLVYNGRLRDYLHDERVYFLQKNLTF